MRTIFKCEEEYGIIDNPNGPWGTEKLKILHTHPARSIHLHSVQYLMTIRGARTAAKASGTADVVIECCEHNYYWLDKVRWVSTRDACPLDTCMLVTPWAAFPVNARHKQPKPSVLGRYVELSVTSYHSTSR